MYLKRGRLLLHEILILDSSWPLVFKIDFLGSSAALSAGDPGSRLPS